MSNNRIDVTINNEYRLRDFLLNFSLHQIKKETTGIINNSPTQKYAKAKKIRSPELSLEAFKIHPII